MCPTFATGTSLLESVHHADAGAEDRDNGELAAGNLLGRHPADRGLYLNVVKWKIAGDLISHQKGNLFKQFAEILEPVSFFLMIVSLCWIMGWSITCTVLIG